ncbi:sarcolemmal membrane-associated protein-like isoform X2 [Symsagittifera roscoffensis]|uniref:sarcolemmal membrane-associated protein-like isoform X2 n=1 Tax=Symsagittifera roscoffensis TaxID=84072 RepID=UPI00307BD23E
MSSQPRQNSAPKLVFASKGNSHPFQERVLYLTEPQKVGRSVGRIKPATNNLIFDCKVLSRNHGIVWYEHNQFWVQDTKSANGTFVANQRLNKGSEESPPKEIFHEDLIQFGVDVVENQRNGVSVTHGCIIGVVYLYHPDGSAAKPVSAPGSSNQILFSSGLPIPTQDLYQLQKYLEEASHREQLLESKLAALQRLVTDTRTCSAESWRALVEEDSLLTRMELLESQLFVLGKNMGEEGLHKEIQLLNDDKLKYAADAKSSVEKIVQEKQQIECKLSDVERCYSETEDECEHLRATSEETAGKLQELATKHTELLEQVQQLNAKLSEAETTRSELSDTYKTEKENLENEIATLSRTGQELNSRIADLEQRLATATAGTTLEEFENEGEGEGDSSRGDVMVESLSNVEEGVGVDKAKIVSVEDKYDNSQQVASGSIVTAEVEHQTQFNERSVDQAIKEQREADDLNLTESQDLSPTQPGSSEEPGVDKELIEPLEDSGFNESEIYLSALESDIKKHSEQLQTFCSHLSEDRQAEFEALRQNNERLLANVELLKSSVEQKTKTLGSLELQLAEARSLMHNEKSEHSQQLSTRDGELAELKKQLNGVKSIEAQLRSEIEVLNKKIEKSQADQKKECDRLKEKLRETEAALRVASEREGLVDRSAGGGADSSRSDMGDQLSQGSLEELQLPTGAFQRTPVKFIDKLRRSEAERERLESEMRFVHVRLRENQSEIGSALLSLKDALNQLRQKHDRAEHEQMQTAITAIQQVSEELCNLQTQRQSLNASSCSLLDRVNQLNTPAEQESILLLSKIPMFIIILAVLCAFFKFIFPDA